MQTVDLFYVNWACDCANFVDMRNYENNPNYEPREEDGIFVEPLADDVKIPESFYKYSFGKILRLTGQFYLDKGIPRGYGQKTNIKPEHARVFRYHKLEILPISIDSKTQNE
jgi:hypothetical protein